MKNFLDLVALGTVRSVTFLIERLPVPLGRGISRFCVSIFRLFMPRLARVGERNLALVFPNKTDFERSQILSESFDSLARTIYDFANIKQIDRAWVDAHCDGSELRRVIQHARTQHSGKGLLIGAMHFGSFEMLFQAYAFVDRPVSVLARPSGLRRLDEWWKRRREIHGHQVFDRKGGHREIVSRLNRGEDVAILFDQNVKRKHAAFVNLFGIPAATSKSMGLAALQTGCPIVFVACAETTPGKYRFIAEEIANPKDEGGSAQEKVHRVVERLHLPLEQVIREHPEQWFWIHRRYKTRPVGEPETLYDAA